MSKVFEAVVEVHFPATKLTIMSQKSALILILWSLEWTFVLRGKRSVPNAIRL